MPEPNDSPPVCTFCSLLCELTRPIPPAQPDSSFGAAFCSKRSRDLEAYLEHAGGSHLPSMVAAVDLETIRQVRHQLTHAKRVLVTGRIQTVDSARGAIAVAERYRATLDVWESEPLFETVLAIQRHGMHSVSLAEAREISTLFIVVGDEAWLEHVPRLPTALSPVGSEYAGGVPMLLMGKWSTPAIAIWKQQGFDVIAIDCEIRNVPGALAQASRQAARLGWESRVGDWLYGSRYTTVIWSGRSSKGVGETSGDLWVESMFQWIARRNEGQRAAALVWSPLEATFQQVCTWSTGYPGRLRFTEQGSEYRPQEYSAARWRDARLSDPREWSDSIVLWIDDTGMAYPDSWVESGVPSVVVSPRHPGAGKGPLVWLPASWSGIEHEDSYFRGDQTVLVRGRQFEQPSGDRVELSLEPTSVVANRPRVNEWLKRLTDL